MKIIDTIQKHLNYFDSLDAKELDVLEKEAYLTTESKGTLFMGTGSVCQSVYFIIDGRMRVYKILPDGKEITLYRIGSGEMCLFSMNCLLNQTPLDMIAKIEIKSTLLVIPGKTFSALTARNLEFQKNIMGRLLGAFSDVLLLLEEVTFHSMNKRLSKYLLTQMEIVSADKKTLKLTHEAIAFELGTAREVISRLLKEFEKQELVSLSRGAIKIMSVDKLNDIANA